MNADAVLHTSNLLLRRFTNDDLDHVFTGLSDPAVIKYYGVSYSTREEAQKQLHFFADIESGQTGKWWAICDAASHIFYGACGLNHINPLHKKGEIGYWLLPAFWGRGIIREALPAVCQYGFTHFHLHRIEAIVESENIPSVTLLQKSGFTHEGTFRECEFKNGKFISLHIYSLLRTDSSGCLPRF